MKDLVVIIGTILLGCLIFNMIAGDSGSLKSAAGKEMKKSIEIYEGEY